MKTINLKTNIMCGACLAKVTPVLNEKVGKGNWQVNTQDPQKTLIVTGECLNEKDIIETVESAGYKAERFS